MFDKIESTVHLIREPLQQYYTDMFSELLSDETFENNNFYVGISVALMIPIFNSSKPTIPPKKFAKVWRNWMVGVLPSDTEYRPLSQNQLAEALMIMHHFFVQINEDILTEI